MARAISTGRNLIARNSMPPQVRPPREGREDRPKFDRPRERSDERNFERPRQRPEGRSDWQEHPRSYSRPSGRSPTGRAATGETTAGFRQAPRFGGRGTIASASLIRQAAVREETEARRRPASASPRRWRAQGLPRAATPRNGSCRAGSPSTAA